MLLEGKVAVVSGVGPNIGRSIALAFAREGADVALAARREEVLRDVAAEVESLGARAICVPTDITDPAQCHRLAAETRAAFGRIDILVNNAFTARPVVLFAESNLEDWRGPMEVNVWGSLNLTQAVLPSMRELGAGTVIMINAGDYRLSLPGYGPYMASKTALRAVSCQLAKELGQWGIRVNSVVPSVTGEGAEIVERFAGEAERLGVEPHVLLEQVAAERALGIIPTPDEVASAVVFFASDLSRAATGQFLHVDGGQVFA
jgi:NAD(P)-dependent dehydrogenase (short-subunit alcohol dehydrogenase family)